MLYISLDVARVSYAWSYPKITSLLTPKIPGPFSPIFTSKMLKFSKKSQKKFKNLKMLKFQSHKDYDLLDLLKNLVKKY
jgi:hypothetical protein